MLKSSSGTEPSLLPHTHDAAPVQSKVAPWLTALQGIDYHSTVHTVYLSHHWEGHHHRMGHSTIVDTLYVVITAQVPLHMNDISPLYYVSDVYYISEVLLLYPILDYVSSNCLF